MAQRFNQNTRNWIADRIDNSEPLYLSRFAEMMREMGYDDPKYKSKKYRNAMKKAYKKEKNRQRAIPFNK